MSDPTTTPTEPREVRRYCDALLLALRTADVPGPRIGEVLTEVRGHLAESGEDPVEAFGPAEEYAASLTRHRTPPSSGQRVREGLTGAVFALGGWTAADAAGALATGNPATLGPVPLVAAGLAGVGAPWLVEQLTSPGRGRAVRAGQVVALALAALTALGLLLDDRLGVAVPAGALLAAGLLALGLGTLGLRGAADPVVDPLTPPAAAAARRRRDGVLLTGALWAWLALLVAVAAGVAVLADRLG